MLRLTIARNLFASTLLAATATLSAAPLTECKTIKVSGNSEYPPILWRDPDAPGTLTGLGRQLLEMAFQDTGIQLEFLDVGVWARAQKEVRVGRVDMLAGAFITDDRQTWMDYVFPSFTDIPSVIWTRKETPIGFFQWEDLKAYQGGTLVNNSFGQDFDAFAKEQLNIDYNNSIANAFRMLNADRYDYVVFELYQGKAILQTLDLTAHLSALSPPISVEGLYYTFSKNSTCNTPALRDYLSEKVKTIVASDMFDTLLTEQTHRWAEQQTSKP
ncbi:substrate-binding periplasmic protein [Thaumasiovibrio subtropicus]|uniref:substrate-binding periplasmic protein n=1 Tax=Thaumasiovibrio subtropicus TaxID=1891207 RepID=UPI000B34CD75|nr:transporter substrate-binding domain-containing protein [Thaumasiovibrio subtropicus]